MTKRQPQLLQLLQLDYCLHYRLRLLLFVVAADAVAADAAADDDDVNDGDDDVMSAGGYDEQRDEIDVDSYSDNKSYWNTVVNSEVKPNDKDLQVCKARFN